MVQPKTATFKTPHLWDATAYWIVLSEMGTFLKQTQVLYFSEVVIHNLAQSVAKVFSSLGAQNSLSFLPDLKSHYTLLVN